MVNKFHVLSGCGLGVYLKVNSFFCLIEGQHLILTDIKLCFVPAEFTRIFCGEQQESS